jgi:diguanylate cyclase (GGDEF)-like protein/PAS domain S-box-containing protein
MRKKGCRILLVENSEKDNEVFEKIVKDRGVPYDFVNAGSLAEAKQACTLYRDIVEATHTLIWRTDTEGRITFLNPAWEESSGYSIGEMVGRPFSDFQPPESAEHYISAFRNCLIGESVIGHETTFFSKKGDEVYLAVNMIPLYNGKGIIGTQGTAHDVTERRHADEMLQYISAKDELTGLYNLHTFLSLTEQQIKTAEREKKEILIIYAGVDGMQLINDVHGREEGDQILIDAASILRKTFREADLFARSGADEFVISTLVSSKNTEEMIMSRFEENIDAYNADKTGFRRLSLSIGSAFYNPERNASIYDTLSKADEKMHECKHTKKVGA